eukprot:jgi/Tetstr1/425523/TSEL_001534.t1
MTGAASAADPSTSSSAVIADEGDTAVARPSPVVCSSASSRGATRTDTIAFRTAARPLASRSPAATTSLTPSAALAGERSAHTKVELLIGLRNPWHQCQWVGPLTGFLDRPIEDLEVVKDVGCGNVDITIGSALDIFGGDLPYSQVVEWHEAQKQLAAQP